jgi:DNA-binding NarL/FixJ family response regulator
MPPPPPETEPTSAVLVDDHELFRGGLRDVLEGDGVRVLGEASDGAHGVELVVELVPDVAVMDLNMPGTGGVAATRMIAQRSPATRVLVLTISVDDANISEALLAGASGCLLKDASVDDLVAGVRAAAAGRSWLSEKLAGRLLASLGDGAAADLSPRELEVLRLLAGGDAEAAVAERVGEPPRAVRMHAANVLAKLQRASRLRTPGAGSG